MALWFEWGPVEPRQATILTRGSPLVNATRPQPIRFPSIEKLIGVDYSGASQSGKVAWLAELVSDGPTLKRRGDARLTLTTLKPLGKLAGADDRDAVNSYLVDRISTEPKTFWGCDFPFGLPIELPLGSWGDQLSHVAGFADSAKEYGLSLVEMTEEHCGTKHVRRTTDSETQTPFDCYHYRIIYQTFHGMRDVLHRVASLSEVCVLPFQYGKLTGGKQSIVVEACPSSTLKRWKLPHQKYKQSGGKPPEDVHKKTRRTIMKTLCKHVEISPHRRRVIMNDPGGDALDAVLAGVGSWHGFLASDHQQVASHARYPHEGRVYC